MGFLDKNQLIKEFVDKVTTLKVGQVYPSVIKSQFGYHIVKLTEKKASGVTPLAEVKDQIKDYLQQHAEAVALHNWLLEKRRTTAIKLSPDFQALVSSDTSKSTPQ